MIITVDQLRTIDAYRTEQHLICIDKIKAVESIVRAYTHNNFQNRRIRFISKSDGRMLLSLCPFLKPDDTIQISNSVNEGLYTVVDTERGIQLDEELYTVDENLVTKVEYPLDIQSGVLDLIRWETTNRNKVGVKSETISRHSVTYYDQDANNTVMGYPISLMAFCEPYMKPRY